MVVLGYLPGVNRGLGLESIFRVTEGLSFGEKIEIW